MTPCSHPRDRQEALFTARDYVTGDQFEIRRCGACGLVMTWPPPTDLGKYYPDAYYGHAGEKRFVGPIEKMQAALYGSRAAQVEKAAGGRPGRVLDVGCGRGFLLDAFRRRGWKVEGTELSVASSAHARERLGIEVHLGTLESLHLPAGAYDAVTMWHVLEHTTNPAVLLQEVHRVLRRGGVFLVGVPNFGSLEARLAGSRWFHLDAPRHLVHFTAATLLELLVESGFDVVSSSSFAPEFDAFSFVQSALNRMGFRQNALYDLLRGQAAKLGEGGGLSAAASMILAAPLGLLSIPATALAGIGRTGATVTVLARSR